jgi:hypothetical protein
MHSKNSFIAGIKFDKDDCTRQHICPAALQPFFVLRSADGEHVKRAPHFLIFLDISSYF